MPQTFEVMLIFHFKGKPGEKKVARHEYRILQAQSYDTSLGAADWETSVKPGMQLVMSIMMEVLSKSTICPRGCSKPLEREGHTKAVW
jgi:hypothetical protein